MGFSMTRLIEAAIAGGSKSRPRAQPISAPPWLVQRRGGRQAVEMNATRAPMTALWEAPQRSGQQPVIQQP